jgi:hypothetical protein
MLYTTRRYVSATITNTGRVAGAEIAQLYLSFPTVPGIDFPPFQLRGFKKVFLKPSESASNVGISDGVQNQSESCRKFESERD